MKKLVPILLSISILLIGCQDNQTSNVGDNQSYQYKITNIEGNEINGKPLDNISDDNKGVFLYKNELDFFVNEGDKISIVWGEEEDIFKSIEKVE